MLYTTVYSVKKTSEIILFLSPEKCFPFRGVIISQSALNERGMDEDKNVQ